MIENFKYKNTEPSPLDHFLHVKLNSQLKRHQKKTISISEMVSRWEASYFTFQFFHNWQSRPVPWRS